MIKFFRKIRQKMLTENKFSKYLIYAIGEIILVVIGILIALSINNWNNDKKDKQAELKYLNQIRKSLQENNLILKERIVNDERTLKFGDQLYNHFKTKKEINDSIKRILVVLLNDQMISFNIAAFENLKNDGLSFISNDDLKFEIINIYDKELKYIQNIFANQFENYLSGVINPFFSNNFEFVSNEKYMSAEPNNYQDLLSNNKITNIISMVNTMRSYAISNYSNTQKKINEIIIKLDKEIKTLNE
ncbi:DUF6090 family protein [Winogradskyella immobilis]|uniref:Uncharacterized protein n=1 Tax=Winogradskyella immobilis TaxID=2816852 RepID=A0ABS8ES96_9FLAO|nr:DUF6090 family protein [Winogradskyella immobilis]MCC1485172.1 hypothetical protein [Winogradskyella immobilis]MCG0017264.1 hypothetical protein [Winogradskyella immobilis]